jgi:hypothetical protein
MVISLPETRVLPGGKKGEDWFHPRPSATVAAVLPRWLAAGRDVTPPFAIVISTTTAQVCVVTTR